MTQVRAHLLLVGGGHAHVAVLADWIRSGRPCKRATLLTPYRHLRYSGTVPGWIAGQYRRDFGLVDLASLAARAGVDLIEGWCTAIDPENRTVTTDRGAVLSFDIASLDTGGVGRARAVLGDDPRLLDVRPIEGFVERLDAMPNVNRIAVVGGGAGGVELAFALRNRAGGALPEVTLVAGRLGLLPDFSPAVRAIAEQQLHAQSIRVIVEDARFEGGVLIAGQHSLEPLDLIVAALGSGAPEWPRAGGLQCDEFGFVATDRQMRSLSHEHIFAVGDVAARQDRRVPHSGVHAVMAGPMLAGNLRAEMGGRPARRSYAPRAASLYLMSTGDGAAIASYGPFAAHGRWVKRLKHWIDNRWLSQYAKLARGE